MVAVRRKTASVPGVEGRSRGVAGLGDLAGLAGGTSYGAIADSMGVRELMVNIESVVGQVIDDLNLWIAQTTAPVPVRRVAGPGLQELDRLSSTTVGIASMIPGGGTVALIAATVGLITGAIGATQQKKVSTRRGQIENSLVFIDTILQRELTRAIQLLARAGDPDAIALLAACDTGPGSVSPFKNINPVVIVAGAAAAGAAALLPVLLRGGLGGLGRFTFDELVRGQDSRARGAWGLVMISDIVKRLGEANNALEDKLDGVTGGSGMIASRPAAPASLKGVGDDILAAPRRIPSFSFGGLGGLGQVEPTAQEQSVAFGIYSQLAGAWSDKIVQLLREGFTQVDPVLQFGAAMEKWARIGMAFLGNNVISQQDAAFFVDFRPTMRSHTADVLRRQAIQFGQLGNETRAAQTVALRGQFLRQFDAIGQFSATDLVNASFQRSGGGLAQITLLAVVAIGMISLASVMVVWLAAPAIISVAGNTEDIRATLLARQVVLIAAGKTEEAAKISQAIQINEKSWFVVTAEILGSLAKLAFFGFALFVGAKIFEAVTGRPVFQKARRDGRGQQQQQQQRGPRGRRGEPARR